MVDVVKGGFGVEPLLLLAVKLKHIFQLFFYQLSVLLLLVWGRAFELVTGIAQHLFGSFLLHS